MEITCGNTESFVVLAVVAVVLGSYIVLHPRPSVRGERDARKDLASGHYILLGYGLPYPWYSEFDQCLQEYGIEVRNIGGDVLNLDVIFRDLTGLERSYYRSYNATSAAAIKKKFGSDVFDRCANTARKKWETSHQESHPK